MLDQSVRIRAACEEPRKLLVYGSTFVPCSNCGAIGARSTMRNVGTKGDPRRLCKRCD